jgi:hypothetical protein
MHLWAGRMSCHPTLDMWSVFDTFFKVACCGSSHVCRVTQRCVAFDGWLEVAVVVVHVGKGFT